MGVIVNLKDVKRVKKVRAGNVIEGKLSVIEQIVTDWIGGINLGYNKRVICVLGEKKMRKELSTSPLKLDDDEVCIHLKMAFLKGRTVDEIVPYVKREVLRSILSKGYKVVIKDGSRKLEWVCKDLRLPYKSSEGVDSIV